MHYITTRDFLFLGTISVLIVLSSFTAQAKIDNRVFYRASDGKDDSVYVISLKRDVLNKIVNRKLYVWKSLKRCKSTPVMSFTDPLFSNEKVTMEVNNDCTLSINDSFGEVSCISNPTEIMHIQTFFTGDLAMGYGAEYLTRYERDYYANNCKIK